MKKHLVGRAVGPVHLISLCFKVYGGEGWDRGEVSGDVVIEDGEVELFARGEGRRIVDYRYKDVGSRELFLSHPYCRLELFDDRLPDFEVTAVDAEGQDQVVHRSGTHCFGQDGFCVSEGGSRVAVDL